MAEDLGDSLSHIHLADGTGGSRDEHLIPGRGNQPCGELLEGLAARATAKMTGWESPGARPLGEWLSQAWMTYALCGLLAGVLSGLLLFRVTRRPPPVGMRAP